MDIDATIDRLIQVTTAAGAPAPHPPSDTSVLDEIEREIAPLRLPPEVRRLWERIAASSLRFRLSPAITSPEFALDSWRQNRAEFAWMTPVSLFLVGYQSWECMSVELLHDDGQGGALYEWALDDDDFERRHEDVSDWLRRWTDLVEAGRYELRDGSRGPVLSIDGYEFPRTRGPIINRAVTDWPVHWRRASGLAPEDAVPRGATHSIAEVLASDPGSTLRARIHATLKSAGHSPAGARGTIADGTGELTIVGSSTLLAYVTTLDELYEVELDVPVGDRIAVATASAIRPLSS